MEVIFELFGLLPVSLLLRNSVPGKYVYFFAITMAGYSILRFYPVEVILHSF